MKTQIVPLSNTHLQGEQLLKRAVASEKDSRRFYGQYVQWVAKHHVPLDVIITQLIKVRGWAVTTARKYAKCIILLGELANSEHLEDLLNGEIDFEVACMRVSRVASNNIVYNDEETATRYLQRAFTIMMHRNKGWKQPELLIWLKNILDKFLANHSK